MKNDLTTGSIWKTIARFSVPYLLSYFLQTLYGMADLFIIGQFNGVESTTAVSIGSQIMHMLTVIIVGLAMGSTVMIGRAIGAGRQDRVSRTIGNTISFFTGASIALMAFMLMMTGQIVKLVSTPEEAVGGTVLYLIICSIGIPFITAYNIIGSVFRGIGDSKSPMYFIAVACGCNILLDYLFIGGLGLGAAGAALGTTLAQTISVIISLIVIRKRDTGIHLKRDDFKIKKETIGSVLRIGIPVACQDGFIQVSFVAITIFANMRGLDDAAAVGIVEKIICILFLVPSAMLQTISVLAAQNIGADKHDRAEGVLKCGLLIILAWGLAVIAFVEPFAPKLIRLFADNDQVVISGTQYLRSYGVDTLFAGIHFCFSGYFCAYGRSGISFLHNMISICFVRVPLSYLASIFFVATLFPMGMCAPMGSVLSDLICLGFFFWLRKKISLQEHNLHT